MKSIDLEDSRLVRKIMESILINYVIDDDIHDGGKTMNTKRWIALVVAVGVMFFSVVSSALSTLFLAELESTKSAFEDLWGKDEPFSEEVIEPGDPFSQIVVLEVNGVIQDLGTDDPLFTSGMYNHRLFMKKLEAIKENENVKGIVLQINSPGGTVVESAQIHDKLVEIMMEREIPVYVSMGSIAASGGYYIAAPATKIFAAKDTITGSIGVIMQGYNISELAEKVGVEPFTIKSGPFKDIGSSTRKMTEEEERILQSLINNAYEDFVRVVAEGRNMNIDHVKTIADGRIYDGRQAKEIGLVDEFGYLEDVISAMKEDMGLEGAEVVRYEDDTFGLSSLFFFMNDKLGGKNTTVNDLIQVLSHHHAPRLMYLYSN